MKRITFTLLFSVLGLIVFAQDGPPEGGTPKGFTLPEKETFTLDNGLSGVMVPWGKIPKAQIQVVIKTGNINESANEVWLSDLVGDLMKEGSVDKTANEIADQISGMGGELNISVSPHATYLSASVLYEFVPDAIALLSEVLTRPLFPESEVERLINDRKRQVNIAKTRPRALAAESFYGSIYPNHAYGRYFPTEEMLDTYDLAKIKGFYDKNFGAKRTVVYVAGVFDRQKSREAIEASFSGWLEGPAVNYPTAEAVTSKGVQMIDRPDAPQSTLMLGLPVVDASNPDYIALSVMNSMLGGSFGSRITQNIREDKGYTYSPFSTIDDRYQSAVWYERADVTTADTGAALREIAKEIDRIQNEEPSEEELTGFKNYDAGIYVLRNATSSGIINQLNFLDLYGLPESFLTDRVKNIHAVTPAKVSEVAKKYIRPEDMTLILVGDKAVIEKQVEEYEQALKDKKF